MAKAPHKAQRRNSATARDVAQRAGVSISAVSRAFTTGASVSPETRQKVLKAAKALGYQPSAIARSLMTGRTELVGLVSNNFDNPAFMQIFDLFTRSLQDHGLRPLIVNLVNAAAPEKAVVMLQQYKVDGVIIASSSVSPKFVEGCLSAGIPLVHAFGPTGRKAGYPVVSADNVQGGRLAAETLLQHGYRHIGFLGGPQEATSTRARLEGFRVRLAEAGVTPSPVLYAPAYSHDGGSNTMAEMMQGLSPEAIFCGDDILAIGAVDACLKAGIDVPGKMGVLGFNDISMAAWPSYDLSTIRQPISAIILEAVQMILQLIAEPGAEPREHLHPCEVVLRGSLRTSNA